MGDLFMTKLLYRGVNKVMDGENGAFIRPKGTTAKVVAKHDGKIKADGKFSCGPSKSNTARAQQIDGSPYDPCAVSTSHSESVARYFATCKNTVDGFVYVIDADCLAKAGITCFDFHHDSEHPHHEEVTLVFSQPTAPIPPSLIVGKYEVKSNGSANNDK